MVFGRKKQSTKVSSEGKHIPYSHDTDSTPWQMKDEDVAAIKSSSFDTSDSRSRKQKGSFLRKLFPTLGHGEGEKYAPMNERFDNGDGVFDKFDSKNAREEMWQRQDFNTWKQHNRYVWTPPIFFNKIFFSTGYYTHVDNLYQQQQQQRRAARGGSRKGQEHCVKCAKSKSTEN